MNKPFLWFAGTMLFLLGQTHVFSQKNYQPGYIVKQDGDTVNGFIAYRNADKNPGKILFKTTEEAAETSYTPLDAKGFGVDNMNFVSGIVKAIEHPDDATLATSEFVLYTDTIFLQVMVRGEKSLYYLKDTKNYPNFYIWNDNKFVLLLYKQYTATDDENKMTSMVKRTYIDQLKVYLSDDNNIPRKIDRTSYEYNSMLDLFTAYYSNQHLTASYKDTKEKVKVEFGVLAGATATTLKFKGNFLADTKLTTSFNITAGLYAEIIFPRHFSNFSLENELMYSSYKVSGTETRGNPTYTSYSTTSDYKIGATYLQLNNLLRYRSTPENGVSYFLNAGISNGFAIGKTNTADVEERHFGAFFSKSTTPALYSFKTYELGVIGGFGAKVKRISGEFRIESGNGVADYLNIKSHTTRFSIIAGYSF